MVGLSGDHVTLSSQKDLRQLSSQSLLETSLKPLWRRPNSRDAKRRPAVVVALRTPTSTELRYYFLRRCSGPKRFGQRPCRSEHQFAAGCPDLVAACGLLQPDADSPGTSAVAFVASVLSRSVPFGLLLGVMSIRPVKAGDTLLQGSSAVTVRLNELPRATPPGGWVVTISCDAAVGVTLKVLVNVTVSPLVVAWMM
jgi:hypothetical protein